MDVTRDGRPLPRSRGQQVVVAQRGVIDCAEWVGGIEDLAVVQKLLADARSEIGGFDVLVADDGLAGLALAQNEVPDVKGKTNTEAAALIENAGFTPKEQPRE